jgi:hypothetical protein
MRIRAGLLIATIAVAGVGVVFSGIASGGLALAPIVVVPGQVQAGGSFNVSGSGCTNPAPTSAEAGAAAFDPATVTVTVSFAPTPLTVVVNTAAGSWSVDLTVPADTLPGTYTVSAECDDGAGPVSVGAAAITPYPGSSVTVVPTQVAAEPVVSAPRTTG